MVGTRYILYNSYSTFSLPGLSNLVCLMLNLSLFIAIILMVCDEFVISVLIILFLTRVIDSDEWNFFINIFLHNNS